MGILALIKRLAFGFLVTFNWAYSFFSRRPKLHGSRFARIDELSNLMTHALDKEGSLILGVSHLSRVLRVKPVKTRRELGNLLVVAPTRGGKGLLAAAQLLTWRHSVVVNDIKGDLPKLQATGRHSGRFLSSTRPVSATGYHRVSSTPPAISGQEDGLAALPSTYQKTRSSAANA